jgi:hypothetical protein
MSSMPGTSNTSTPDTSAPDTAQRDLVHPGAASAGSGWTGWIVFAAALLFLAGLAQLLQGFVALFDDDFYVVGSDGLALGLNYTVWGVVHLMVGTLACLIGVGLLSGNMVARGAAVILAGFSAVANLVFLAAYPAWSLVIIAVDIAVIHAVVVHGGELEAPS